MRSSRSRKRAAFSLFAFQDIIISVTGILLLITLLLTIELIQRKDTTSAEVTDDVIGEMQNAVAEMQDEIAELESQLIAGDDFALEVASSSPTALRQENAELVRLIEDLQGQIESLEQSAEQAQERLVAARAEQFDRREEAKRLEELRDEIARIEGELEQVRSEDRLIFNDSGQSGKVLWIVIVEGDRISLRRPSTTAAPIVLAGSTGSLTRRFLKWIRDNANPQRDQLTILIRPSGAPIHVDLMSGLRSERFSYGFDLIGADQSVDGF